MKKAFKYRLYPTDSQKELLAQTFGCVRFVYNRVLAWRSEEYKENGVSVSYSAASAKLTALKKDPEFSWLKDVSSVPLQQALRHQQAAFNNFFQGRAKYPKLKRKHHKQSISLVASAFSLKDGKLYMAKSKEPLNIRLSRPFPGAPSSMTVSLDRAGRYFVSVLCDVDIKPMPITAKMVGIDLGLNDLFVSSDGAKSGNPKYTKRYEAKLARLQRQLSRKKKGSSNRNKARQKVARLHAKIADCRLDAAHKASRKLINENQVVCVEDLAIKNMLKNKKLAKHIADAGWSEFVRQLQYKAEWAGRSVLTVDRWFPSSKTCGCCGSVVDSLPLDVRSWTCSVCGSEHDRDINAAKNILTAGLAGRACGATETGEWVLPASREGVLKQETC